MKKKFFFESSTTTGLQRVTVERLFLWCLFPSITDKAHQEWSAVAVGWRLRDETSPELWSHQLGLQTQSAIRFPSNAVQEAARKKRSSCGSELWSSSKISVRISEFNLLHPIYHLAFLNPHQRWLPAPEKEQRAVALYRVGMCPNLSFSGQIWQLAEENLLRKKRNFTLGWLWHFSSSDCISHVHPQQGTTVIP